MSDTVQSGLKPTEAAGTPIVTAVEGTSSLDVMSTVPATETTELGAVTDEQFNLFSIAPSAHLAYNQKNSNACVGYSIAALLSVLVQRKYGTLKKYCAPYIYYLGCQNEVNWESALVDDGTYVGGALEEVAKTGVPDATYMHLPYKYQYGVTPFPVPTYDTVRNCHTKIGGYNLVFSTVNNLDNATKCANIKAAVDTYGGCVLGITLTTAYTASYTSGGFIFEAYPAVNTSMASLYFNLSKAIKDGWVASALGGNQEAWSYVCFITGIMYPFAASAWVDIGNHAVCVIDYFYIGSNIFFVCLNSYSDSFPMMVVGGDWASKFLECWTINDVRIVK